jgi:hypothetical protein
MILMLQKQTSFFDFVDHQKCSFCEVVKMCNGLHHYIPLVEMVEKHIWNVQFGVRMRELCLRENICLGTGTSGLYFRSETRTSGGDRNFQWLAEEGAVLHENNQPVLLV